MVDDADLIELFETDLDRLIMVGHKQGLSYPRIFYCMLHRLEDKDIMRTRILEIIKTLDIQEFWLDKNVPRK